MSSEKKEGGEGDERGREARETEYEHDARGRADAIKLGGGRIEERRAEAERKKGEREADG